MAHQQVALECKVCHAVGLTTPCGEGASGMPLSAVPLLPRCVCHARAHLVGKVAQLDAIIGTAPPIPDAWGWGGAQQEGAASSSSTDADVADGAAPPVEPARRPVYSVDRLPSERELVVYDTTLQGKRLGSIVISKELKLSALPQLLCALRRPPWPSPSGSTRTCPVTHAPSTCALSFAAGPRSSTCSYPSPSTVACWARICACPCSRSSTSAPPSHSSRQTTTSS